MKKKKLIQILLFVLLLTSCTTTNYFYQVCKVVPENNIHRSGNWLVYEDNNCSVEYNLWDEGGNIGFTFYNKTTTNIYLNLEECFFVINGIANNYYKNRVFSYSTNTGTSKYVSKSMSGINYLDLSQTNTTAINMLNTQGVTVSMNEEKIICIPSMSSKSIKEYNIVQLPYRDCDLLRYPLKKQIKTLNFTMINSPFSFGNRIEYKVGSTGKPVKFENNFYISEITNYPKSQVIESRREMFCGQEANESQYNDYFIKVNPDEFYIKYSAGSIMKH